MEGGEIAFQGAIMSEPDFQLSWINTVAPKTTIWSMDVSRNW